MAVELGRYNIRVNSIAPTVVMTEMGKMAWSDPKKAEVLLNRIPLGRFAGTNNKSENNLILIVHNDHFYRFAVDLCYAGMYNWG